MHVDWRLYMRVHIACALCIGCLRTWKNHSIDCNRIMLQIRVAVISDCSAKSAPSLVFRIGEVVWVRPHARFDSIN
jgi:hypothetical protein